MFKGSTSDISIITAKFCLSICLSETSLTLATLVLHGNIITVLFWDKDDPWTENLPLSFGSEDRSSFNCEQVGRSTSADQPIVKN